MGDFFLAAQKGIAKKTAKLVGSNKKKYLDSSSSSLCYNTSSTLI